MAERVLSGLLKFLSTPIICVAKSVAACNAFGIRTDIEKCLRTVDSQNTSLPNSFTISLIAAEDHRNAIHCGIDLIAILRAMYVSIRCGDIQGASTVEQQFVRVVSGRYECTISRKLYEQILAICVSNRRSKAQIANAYLAIAHYGSAMVGMTAIRSKLGDELSTVNRNCIREMIARLKYPEPFQPTPEWRRKIQDRVVYIESREAQIWCRIDQ